jgi:hypothetical protein
MNLLKKSMGHSQYFSSKNIVFTKGFPLQSISIDSLVSISSFVSLHLGVYLEEASSARPLRGFATRMVALSVVPHLDLPLSHSYSMWELRRLGKGFQKCEGKGHPAARVDYSCLDVELDLLFNLKCQMMEEN